MDLYPVDWKAGDVDDTYVITAFGKTPDGVAAAAHITFYPYFFVQVPLGYDAAETKSYVTDLCTQYKAAAKYCRVVERVSLWGFTNSTKVRLVQLAFASHQRMRAAARRLQSAGRRTFESGIDPLLRFFHVRDISPSQWICVKGFDHVDERRTRAEVEVSASFEQVAPSQCAVRPPLVIASWDAEMYSASRRFPSADNETDAIIQIATSFMRYGDERPYKQIVFCLKSTDPVPGVDIVCFDEEHDMINAWMDEIARQQVDVLLGYNTDQFDWRYVYGRSLICVDDMTGESMVDLTMLGRALEGGGALRERQLNSGAYGQNSFSSLATPGVLQLDLLQQLRREYKLDSYSLNNVSRKFLGDAKVDLPPGEIFNKFEGTPADRATIAEYAAKDTLLPLLLLNKLCVYENLAEMSSATYVPLEYVLQRGQQIKVYSVLMKKARAMGYVCPDNVRVDVQGKYAGATVLNAERGAYFDIVSGLDFCSLYPSIIRAWNLDYSTIVLDKRYDNVPGIQYYEVATDQGTFRFAQGVPSVLPALLEDLAKYRKAAKKKMAEAKARRDAFQEAVHNGEQLAFKVTMNSAYGFVGATKGFLTCVPIAASVTATGRRMIQQTKQLVETMVPGSRVVYGDTDSVMCILDLGSEKRHDLASHFQAAARLAADISATFPHPVELEFEKCYFPYLLFSKKRYAGLMYTRPDAHDYIDVKGLQLVRRDSCPLVKDVSQSILNRIMFDRSPEKAVEEARECIVRVLAGQEPWEKFVITKALRSDYKNNAQPHVHVAKKILRRTGAAVPSGVRVPFVFVEDPANPDGLLAERAEDPTYARNNNLVLDVLFYIHHQLESPITALLELMVDDPSQTIFGSPQIKPTLDAMHQKLAEDVKVAKRIRKNKSKNQAEITHWFKPST